MGLLVEYFVCGMWQMMRGIAMAALVVMGIMGIMAAVMLIAVLIA